MPIVDGLTSTKMIRSHEKSHPQQQLSRRAALNGRIPIIAVSASLVEKERQTYINAGFDGWILKPISFSRLNELVEGIVNPDTREAALYKPGNWGNGGWFEMAQPEKYRPIEAKGNTAPEQSKIPGSGSTLIAAMTYGAGDDATGGTVPDEQRCLLEEQERSRYLGHPVHSHPLKSQSAPQLGKRGFPPYDESTVQSITGEEVATPEPINEEEPRAPA
jgi:CheY-like chemotaxis protein